jgi:diguanylate cyclase (GGDEF)-like protein
VSSEIRPVEYDINSAGVGDDGGAPFAVLTISVDNLQAFVEVYEPPVGDRVLLAVADQLKLMTDGVGIAGRFGDDGFVVVLPDHDRAEASAFAQAFQDWLATYTFGAPGGLSLPIVISSGLAVCPDDGVDRRALTELARSRLDASRAANGRGDGAGVVLDSMIAAADGKDQYARAHREATARYAVLLAQEMGATPASQRTLRLAALLHDVGQIGIPEEILRKPGGLTEEEFAVIKHHVTIAERLIVDVPNAPEVRELVRHHHERYDGGGYPDGLRGKQIPRPARMLAVADAFSAMTLDRPYRLGLSPARAYAELRRVAGSQLDPELVKTFGRVLARLEREAASYAPASAPGRLGTQVAAG